MVFKTSLVFSAPCQVPIMADLACVMESCRLLWEIHRRQTLKTQFLNLPLPNLLFFSVNTHSDKLLVWQINRDVFYNMCNTIKMKYKKRCQREKNLLMVKTKQGGKHLSLKLFLLWNTRIHVCRLILNQKKNSPTTETSFNFSAASRLIKAKRSKACMRCLNNFPQRTIRPHSLFLSILL